MYKIPGASFCFQIEMVFKFLLRKKAICLPRLLSLLKKSGL